MFGNLGNIASALGGISFEELKEWLAKTGQPIPATPATPAVDPNAGAQAAQAAPAAAPVSSTMTSAPGSEGERSGILSSLQGLLGGSGDRGDDIRQGLLEFGMNLMANSGPSDDPASASLFSAIGKSGAAGLKGFREAGQDRVKNNYIKSQTGAMNAKADSDAFKAGSAARATAITVAAGAMDPNSPEYAMANYQAAVAREDNTAISYWQKRLDPKGTAAANAVESYGTAQGSEAASAPRRADEAANAASKENVDNVTKLGQEWRQSKTFNDFANLSRARGQAEALADNPNAAAFVSLVYDFAKTKDPGSAVMDGERMMLTGTSSLPDQITSWFNRAQSGEAPPREVMQNLVSVIDQNYQAARSNYEYDKTGRMDTARSLGIDPTKIYNDPAKMFEPYQTQAQRDVARSVAVSGGGSAPVAPPAQAPAQAGKARNPTPSAEIDVTGMSQDEMRRRGVKRGMTVIRDGQRFLVK